MEEFDELLAEAKKRHMYVLMDLVINHCSDSMNGFRRRWRTRTGNTPDIFIL